MVMSRNHLDCLANSILFVDFHVNDWPIDRADVQSDRQRNIRARRKCWKQEKSIRVRHIYSLGDISNAAGPAGWALFNQWKKTISNTARSMKIAASFKWKIKGGSGKRSVRRKRNMTIRQLFIIEATWPRLTIQQHPPSSWLLMEKFRLKRK